jgi:regulatory protein
MFRRKKETEVTPDEVFLMAVRYCAYQERCTSEVRQFFIDKGMTKEQMPELFDMLKAERFLDDARFCRAFVGGKFRGRHWGKRKIYGALLIKGLPEQLIQAAIESEILPEDYEKARLDIIERFFLLRPDADKAALYRHLTSKGYDAS